jgi:ribonucleoside-diphosphate reductase alpha chain
MKTKEVSLPGHPADPAGMQVFTHEEAMAAATEYFHGDTLAAGVWLNKYALKDSLRQYLRTQPDDMHRRIAAKSRASKTGTM